MKSMTRRQAYNYIMAGFFPKKDDIDSIVDLQDIFGHQTYWFILSLLINEETKENALTLFNLIWSETEVDSLLRSVNNYYQEQADYVNNCYEIRTLKNEIIERERKIEQLTFENDKLSKQLDKQKALLTLQLDDEEE